MKDLKKLIIVLFAIMLFGIGITFMMKALMGLGAYDALNATISNITNIKVGNITSIVNGSLILVQIILLWKDFPLKQLLQFVVIILLGFSINFFYYDIAKFELSNYFIRLVFFVIGNMISAFAAGLIVNANFIYTPLEGAINAFSNRTKTDFVKNRFIFDIACIVFTLTLSLIFRKEILIREGTVIAALIFSPMIGIFLRLQKPLFEKYGLDE